MKDFTSSSGTRRYRSGRGWSSPSKQKKVIVRFTDDSERKQFAKIIQNRTGYGSSNCEYQVNVWRTDLDTIKRILKDCQIDYKSIEEKDHEN